MCAFILALLSVKQLNTLFTLLCHVVATRNSLRALWDTVLWLRGEEADNEEMELNTVARFLDEYFVFLKELPIGW